MDNLRGNFEPTDLSGDDRDYDVGEDDTGREEPPAAIGQDERRMQVRAYNHWASLLQDRQYPGVEDLVPENLPDFGPYSVLLDFTGGIEDPAIQYLGDKLAAECDATADIGQLSDVPSRSLLTRITDHYMQIIANQAPIGFEAEFVNQRGAAIMYRGILLPFSSDDETIDFIYGVINWKELADQITTDELLLEIDQALVADDEEEAEDIHPRESDPITDWADGPAAETEDDSDDSIYELGVHEEEETLIEDGLPAPSFGSLTSIKSGEPSKPMATEIEFDHEPVAEEFPDFSENGDFGADESFDEPASDDIADDPEIELSDWLASARSLADAANYNEDRSRHALYAAIGRAYDFSLAAKDSPADFEELVTDSGLTVQDRAPMTPVVKLVFGADYDKTRLTEYAAALSHAHRLELERGQLSKFLKEAQGGLKGVVKAERQLRREESGKTVDPIDAPREKIAKQLRELETKDLLAIDPEGAEFGLVMIRRLPDGQVVMVGEISDDIPLVERAARKLIG
ncbi:hypothetical protein [Altererythrobacter sp. ZODW24]|uniref:PAS domain-containing protein n=1 Tax=Altererythrobacter sp. ZODW24 TaxID=2185142 RepID=UPI000DF7340E|nr:hypothetical protein [Altererythrobacter sp. ZODW24]